MKKIISLLLAFSFFSSSFLIAQAGSLDPGFSGDGKLVFDASPIGYCVAVQSDGKILIGGFGTSTNSNKDFFIARLTPDGVFDASFGGGDGIVLTDIDFGNDRLFSLALQPDGKIVASGRTGFNAPVFATVRYNSDGSLDHSFGNQGVTKTTLTGYDSQTSMALQPDGKIIVAGNVLVGSLWHVGLTRLKTDGTLDSTFSQDGILIHDLVLFETNLNAIAVQPDGKIVATGNTFSQTNNERYFFITRYLPNGLRDSSFATNGLLYDKFANNTSDHQSRAIVLQQNGKIVIGGYNNSNWALARYNSNGTVDPTFDADGKIITQIPLSKGSVNALAIQPDGKIVAAGVSTSPINSDDSTRFTVVRYLSNGALDNSFGVGGIKVTSPFVTVNDDVVNDVIFDMAIQSDGKIIAVGYTEKDYQYKTGVMRYLTNLGVGIINNYSNVLCFSGNTGSATAEPFGGITYTYLWSNGQTTKTATSLSAGTYTVTVTGSGGGGTVTASVTITQPPALTITASVSGALTCLQTTVTATAIVGGGKPGYNILWSNTESGPTATFSAPGTYLVTVTDANGCTRTSSVTVVNGDVSTPTAIVSPGGTLTCLTTQLALSGSGSSQGSAYAYHWTTPDGHIVSGDNTLSPIVNQCGTYTLTVTKNSNGCTSSASTTVACDNDLPNVSVGNTDILTCVNVNVTLNGSSTTSGVNYLWTGPSGYTSTDSTPSANTPGSYFLVVTNPANSCTSAATVAIEQNTTPPTALIAQPGNLNCLHPTVLLNAIASSQGPDFTYLWTTSDGFIESGETTLTPIGSAAGSYTLQVTNTENGCTATAGTTVIQHTAVVTSISYGSNVGCNGGSNGAATALASGGNGTYSYAWSNSAATPTVTGLSAGMYEVTATDGEGCTSASSIIITQPDPVLANATATGETFQGASNGTAAASPTGGTPGYTYSWSNGLSTASITGLAPGSYSVTVQDANGCSDVQSVTVNEFNCTLSAAVSGTNINCFGSNSGTATAALSGGQLPYTYLWSNGATTATINNLAAGTYSVTVTDGASCETTGTVELTQPQPLTATVDNIQNVLCLGEMTGAAMINTTGGTAPYNYAGNLNNLGTGDYSVTVTDANGCSSLVSFSILATDNEAPVMVCPENIVVCGAGIVDYDSPTTSDNCSGAVSISLISGLPSGAHFVEGSTVQTFRATDANGNSSTCSFMVVVQPTPAVALEGVVHDQNGQGSGAISISGSGGTGNLAYSWTKNGQLFSTLEDLTGLTEGIYSLVVTDGNGCSVTLGPVQVSNTVGLVNPSESISLKLFPNPCTSAFQLDVSGAKITTARIYNIQGQLVYDMQPMEWLEAVSVERFSNGIYYLSLMMDSGKVFALKFVKTE